MSMFYIGLSLVLDRANMALPSVYSSSATSWSAESMSEAADGHNGEGGKTRCCGFVAHHVCRVFLRKKLEEQELCMVA